MENPFGVAPSFVFVLSQKGKLTKDNLHLVYRVSSALTYKAKLIARFYSWRDASNLSSRDSQTPHLLLQMAVRGLLFAAMRHHGQGRREDTKSGSPAPCLWVGVEGGLHPPNTWPHAEPQGVEVTSFGNRVFADVAK